MPYNGYGDNNLGSKSEVFLRKDIEAILGAIFVSHQSVMSMLDSEDADLFGAGFRAAIVAMATATHIDPRGTPSLSTCVNELRTLGAKAQKSLR